MTGVAVRPAVDADAEAVAALLGELGYPAEPPAVRDRIKRMTARADAGILVAEVGGAPAAILGFQVVEALERDAPQCRLTTLVTDPALRRHGAARALVEGVERWAREHGCFRLEVTTRPNRTEAQAFYEALGFSERPLRLAKRLD